MQSFRSQTRDFQIWKPHMLALDVLELYGGS